MNLCRQYFFTFESHVSKNQKYAINIKIKHIICIIYIANDIPSTILSQKIAILVVGIKRVTQKKNYFISELYQLSL